MPICFFEEDISFKLKNSRTTGAWLRKVMGSEKKTPGAINYIFCSDRYLLSINQQYLKHNTYTDIITFDYSEDAHVISGDIFISIERVRENAEKLKVSFDSELHRVMVHGVLHLSGYKDKSTAQKRIMRNRENTYLSLR